jgi:FkbM family methyltransferase
MKRFFVSSRFLPLLTSVREKRDLIYTACSNVSELGTISNDSLGLELITRILKPGTTFIDIGAHIGSVVGGVRRNVPSVKVVAIEAVPEKARHLRTAFPGIEIHQCAVGDSEGHVPFFVNLVQSGYSSLTRPSDSTAASVIELQVPIKRLDQLVAASDMDSIKIDVEGAELQVLRGSELVISNNRPLIMFESGAEAEPRLEIEKGAIWDFFYQIDYAIIVPNRLAHDGPGLGRDGYLEAHFYPRRTTNYFAVPNERRIEYRDRARKLQSVIVAD